MAANLSTTPAMAPPDGQVSHFDAPYNSLQIGIVVAFGVTYFFASVFLGLRYLQAFTITRKVEIDLVVITISYGVSLFYFISMVELMKHGWGKHLWDVSLADLVQFNKGLLQNTLAYLICPSITKIAMLSVLFRVNPSWIYRGIVIAAIVCIFSYTLVLCIITGGPCNPLKSGTTTCLENVAVSQAALNIASDFAVVAIPIPTIHNLMLSLKQKLTIGSILAIGSAVVICSIARLPYVIVLGSTSDVTYTEAVLGVWSIVEVNVGIVCCCAMRMKRLLMKYFPRLFSSARSTGTNGDTWKNGYPSGKSGQRSYQLHSIQKGSGEPITDDKVVHVYQTFRVDAERSGGDSGSTDQILA